MRTCLIVVDVQSDFLPGGALAVPDGDQVIHPLTQAAKGADLVVATRDWHPHDHISFEQWPPHCIQDTPGAKIHPKIARLANYTISKGVDPTQEAYSGFSGSTLRPVHTLEELLHRHGIQHVIIGGLALDYCVRWTALDANALGFDTVVPLDCTAAIDAAGYQDTLDSFERAGVQVFNHPVLA